MTRPERHAEFQTLIEEHRKILFKVSNSYCRSRDDREDLAQEIAIQLWRSFDSFDPAQRFSTWMYRIALNVAISFYRRESVRTRYVQADSERLLEIGEEPARVDDAIALNEFMERLDPLSRALVLLYLDGNNYREISDVLGISETNVSTKINRLKQGAKP